MMTDVIYQKITSLTDFLCNLNVRFICEFFI